MVNKQFDQISQNKLMNSTNFQTFRNWLLHTYKQLPINKKHFQTLNKHLQNLIPTQTYKNTSGKQAFSKQPKKLK